MTGKELGVHGARSRRPTPAFILACIALFVALGGTGYAASQLTKSQVNKLIARYFKAHKSALRGATGLTGPRGPAGTNGTNGGTGPQGPGASHIDGTETGNTSVTPVATAGLWTVSLGCSASGFRATLAIDGPGTYWATKTIGAANAGAASSFEGNGTVSAGSPGFALAADGQQGGESVVLESGSTRMQLNVQVTATNGGLFETCRVVGNAIPVS
jgi:hypothetical protein